MKLLLSIYLFLLILCTLEAKAATHSAMGIEIDIPANIISQFVIHAAWQPDLIPILVDKLTGFLTPFVEAQLLEYPDIQGIAKQMAQLLINQWCADIPE